MGVSQPRVERGMNMSKKKNGLVVKSETQVDDLLISLGVYRHYKGNLYEVVGFAKHSETTEDMVIY